MNPAEWLVRAARRWPTAPALQTGLRVEADYAAFACRAASIGAALRTRHGIGRQDRVGIFMSNRRAYLEALYGLWFAGAVAVPINAKLHVREAAQILEDSGARLAIVSDDVGQALGGILSDPVQGLISADGKEFEALAGHEPLDAPVPIGTSEMAWLFYTSGTTGRPKGAMLTSANLQAMTFSYFIDVDTVEQRDAALYAAPMSHGAGLYNFMHVLRGARHVVPDSGGFDAGEVLRLAPRIGHVSMFAAPTMVRRLVDAAKADGSGGAGIKTIVYGGGPMYLTDAVEAVDVLGPRLVQIYGQGESPMTITALSRALVADRSHPRWRERLASVGVAQSPVRVRVADPEGRDVPAGAVGEVLVQGSPVIPGYWRDPEATALTIRDGWLWTGDMGALDAEGFLTLHDRSKDVIISGGSNVYPREVEEVLLHHADVREAAVVGRIHPEWGEEVVAFVTPAPGVQIDPAALDRHCLEHIARFKRPKAYVVVAELPKNNYGKVLKTVLRQRLEKEKQDGPHA